MVVRDDRLKRRHDEPAATTCEQCDKHPSVRCPNCPKGPGKASDHGFSRLAEENPELARVQVRNARAAFALARCPESHPAYPGLDAEYIAAGEELRALRAR